jgi:hypothetical protein
VIVRVVVTVLPGVTRHSALASCGCSLTRLIRFTETRLASMVRALAVCTSAGRAGGLAAI